MATALLDGIAANTMLQIMLLRFGFKATNRSLQLLPVATTSHDRCVKGSLHVCLKHGELASASVLLVACVCTRGTLPLVCTFQ
jgi:hypothetical protein